MGSSWPLMQTFCKTVDGAGDRPGATRVRGPGAWQVQRCLEALWTPTAVCSGIFNPRLHGHPQLLGALRFGNEGAAQPSQPGVVCGQVCPEVVLLPTWGLGRVTPESFGFCVEL